MRERHCRYIITQTTPNCLYTFRWVYKPRVIFLHSNLSHAKNVVILFSSEFKTYTVHDCQKYFLCLLDKNLSPFNSYVCSFRYYRLFEKKPSSLNIFNGIFILPKKQQPKKQTTKNKQTNKQHCSNSDNCIIFQR